MAVCCADHSMVVDALFCVIKESNEYKVLEQRVREVEAQWSAQKKSETELFENTVTTFARTMAPNFPLQQEEKFWVAVVEERDFCCFILDLPLPEQTISGSRRPTENMEKFRKLIRDALFFLKLPITAEVYRSNLDILDDVTTARQEFEDLTKGNHLLRHLKQKHDDWFPADHSACYEQVAAFVKSI